MRHSALHDNQLTGALPSELGKLNPAYCVLTNAQCPSDFTCAGTTSTNDFACPVPPISSSCTANLDIACPTPVAQVHALEALYAAAGGEGWVTKTNWMSGDPCTAGSIWYGVTCSGGNVTSLHLNDNGLNGTLPSEVGQLTAITQSL